MASPAGDEEQQELPASKLGTFEHWQFAYERELAGFEESGLEGEVWFGQSAVDDMLQWIEEHCPEPLSSSEPFYVLDVGAGNCHLLHALISDLSYPPSSLTAIDYAPAAVSLARAITAAKGIEGMRIEQIDVLRDDLEPPRGSGEGWDLVIDKGTYDAIALSDERINGQSPRSLFPSRIARLTKPGGNFLLTSCNFTDSELISAFESTSLWNLHSRVQPTKTFSFGGQTGSTTVTVAFERVR